MEQKIGTVTVSCILMTCEGGSGPSCHLGLDNSDFFFLKQHYVTLTTKSGFQKRNLTMHIPLVFPLMLYDCSVSTL